jgi:hypothetical protein
VVSWEGMRRVGASESFSFELVLYHQSGQMALQYQAWTPAGAVPPRWAFRTPRPGWSGLPLQRRRWPCPWAWRLLFLPALSPRRSDVGFGAQPEYAFPTSGKRPL